MRKKHTGPLLLFAATVFLSLPVRAQTDNDTIPLPASMPSSIKDGTVTAIDTYPQGRLLSLKIRLADVGQYNQDKAFDAVTDWLKNSDMEITDISADKKTISLSATVKTAEDFFHVSIHQYEIDSLLYYANSQPPSIPIPLNGIVTAVDGLDNFPRR